MGKTIVVFAPHPDDETLACGGTIAGKVMEGVDVRLVFMTDGGNSHLHELGIACDPSPQELAHIRREEAIRAAGVLGVKPQNLGFLGFESNDLVRDREVVAEKVRAIMLDLSPDEVYYPDRADSHRTHRAACDAVEDSLKTLEFSPAKYRYIVWTDKSGLVNSNARKMVIDITINLPLKTKAIHEYRSQVTLFSAHQSRPVLSESLLSEFLSGCEIFYH